MNFKKVFLPVLLLTGVSLASYSQTSFGLRAGVNFQNLNGKDDAGDKLENKLKVGFNAGVTADIPVASPDYFVQTGLLFSTKGAKLQGFTQDVKANISYLEVPITFLYKPLLGTGHLLVGVGPYVGFAVGGKFDDEKIDFGDDLKRFDAGGNILFGYEFTQKVSAQLNAQLGLVNILPDNGNGDATLKNTGFGISLGYRL